MDKEPIFSERVSAGTRVYYVDAHADSKGQPYISISEIPTEKAPGRKKRQRVFIHAEHIDELSEALAKVARYVNGKAHEEHCY